MKNLSKSLIYLLILLLIFTSCKAYRNVENLKPSTPRDKRGEVFEISSLEKLVEGDKLLIKSKDKKTHYIYFKEVQAEMLMGTLWKEGSKKLSTTSPFSILVTEIEILWVERVSPVATITNVISGAALISFIALIIALSTWDLGF